MHQFQDKRTGTAKQLPLGISYVSDFDTYNAQLMQNFHADHVHADHAGNVAAPSALVEIAFDSTLAATGHRKYDTAAAARGGSISKSPAACDNMPPDFTQSVRPGGRANFIYTASCGTKFTGVKAAWAHHDPSGEAQRVFKEAKEAAKVATKRESKEACRQAAKEATFAASIVNGDKTASIVNGAVICCVRANCQGTQKYTGASWTHQFGKRKQICCTSCGKELEASKWVVVAA
jgi:hypothetical protein